MQCCLNGIWKIACDPDNIGREQKWFEKIREEAHDAPVPGIIQQVFPEYHGVAWYWRTLPPLAAPGPNERCLLTFGAVDYLADAWLNGHYIGGHEGGETPFTLDITSPLRPGRENLLAVRVLNPTDEPIDGIRLVQTPHRNKLAANYQPGASYNYGGIIEPVEMRIVPAVRVADVFVRPNPHNGQVRLHITVQNDTPAVVAGELFAQVGPARTADVQAADSRQARFAPGRTVHEILLQIPEFLLWDIDDPNLYRAEVKLSATDAFLHEHMVRFGFRELCVQNGYFHLNGRRIFLKSTHTGNHMPIGQVWPTNPDLLRRDLLMAKTCGYNTVRFIAGVAHPQQLDFCDEIGLMVYEECLAGWCLADSPDMARRFDLSVREMVLRDRNHPCVTIWGLLNETCDGPIFRHAVETLPLVRELDETRLVLLSSGRWDGHYEIGSVCNPGSTRWEHQWGAESPDYPPPRTPKTIGSIRLAYYEGAGDAHLYPPVPHPPAIETLLRTLGRDTKPVFLSEYGTGSLLNVIRGCRWFEQIGAREDLPDAARFRGMAEKLQADWQRWGFEDVYPFCQDMLRDSERLHVTQRRYNFDLVRSNPKLCGWNLTGMLDHGLTGEGPWTFWREWKPGACEAISDGWAPLRWCLFVTPMHAYAGDKVRLEAVLANEDVLPPGEYPATLRVHGQTGTIWEKDVTLRIPEIGPGGLPPMAIPAFCEEVTLHAPAGRYVFAAELRRCGAPFGDRKEFYLSDRNALPKAEEPAVRLFGVAGNLRDWLESRGLPSRPLRDGERKQREVILVGEEMSLAEDKTGWQTLAEAMARGACAVFLSPRAFRKLPEKPKRGKLERLGDWQTSWREFDVPNVTPDESTVFSKEFCGPFSFLLSELPDAMYTVELGMCEGYTSLAGERIFHVEINGRRVLENFDILQSAGGFHRAVIRRFSARPLEGRIEIKMIPKNNAPSISRLRVFDETGEQIAYDDAYQERKNTNYWLPLENKGKIYELGDWLYHKECVARRHPLFEGLPAPGILDWDYYGPVISSSLFDGLDAPDDIAAAAFAVGYPCPDGYVSALMLASYPFGAGRFILNAFRIVENLDTHPAADRLMLNLIRYAGTFCREPLQPLPKNFDAMLKSIGYVEE